jgi:deoxyribose-phosphate aldolase
MPINRTQLAQAIDHTLLAPTATREAIEVLCREARDYGFFSVCVGPRWVPLAADLLADSPVKITTVTGFPLGNETTRIKVLQAKEAIFDGADEIEMVADLSAVIEQDTRLLIRQCQGVLKVCRSMRPAVTLKLIIESAALTPDQKALVCQVAEHVGADFIVTGTGLHAAGCATVEDVRLIKEQAPSCRIKASGGICTVDQAVAMLEAGAARVGTCASVTLVNALPQGT